MSNFFRYKDFVLEYIVFGNGPEKMLALHGFGRNANDFLVFEDALKDKYTVFSFAIFHHGKSEYPDNRIHSNTLQKQELIYWQEKMKGTFVGRTHRSCWRKS